MVLHGGKRPLAVGFFSLGHSTDVLLIAVALGLTIRFEERWTTLVDA
jgi:high-affinity nickel permease